MNFSKGYNTQLEIMSDDLCDTQLVKNYHLTGYKIDYLFAAKGRDELNIYKSSK